LSAAATFCSAWAVQAGLIVQGLQRLAGALQLQLGGGDSGLALFRGSASRDQVVVGLGQGEGCLGLGELGFEQPVVKAYQRLAGLHRLAFFGQHFEPARNGHRQGRPMHRHDHTRGRDHRVEGCIADRLRRGRRLCARTAGEKQAE
jgi:hypothetical protein